MSVEYRTITLHFENGDYLQLELHPDWRVTFGYPVGNRAAMGSKELRIYETKEKQRACFVGVQSFWDEGLKLKRLVVGQGQEQMEPPKPTSIPTVVVGQLTTDDPEVYEPDGGEVYEGDDPVF